VGANPRAFYVLKDVRGSRPTLRKLQISRGVILVGRVRSAHHLNYDVNRYGSRTLPEFLKKKRGSNFRILLAL